MLNWLEKINAVLFLDWLQFIDLNVLSLDSPKENTSFTINIWTLYHDKQKYYMVINDITLLSSFLV